MKLIANLDIPANMAVADVEMLESLPVEGFIARAGQEIEFEYIEDLGYESEEVHYLAADPVIDGLARFRHPDAPWGELAVSVAKALNEKWNALVEEDSFEKVIPAEEMVGTTFQVLCWKDFGPIKAGEVLYVTIDDLYGFGTNGFVFDESEVVVDTVEDAINHFVLV